MLYVEWCVVYVDDFVYIDLFAVGLILHLCKLRAEPFIVEWTVLNWFAFFFYCLFREVTCRDWRNCAAFWKYPTSSRRMRWGVVSCMPALKHLWNSFFVSSKILVRSFVEILRFISRWLGVLCSLCMMLPAWPESGWSTLGRQSNYHHPKPWTTAHPGQRETERTGTCGVWTIWFRSSVKCCRTLNPCPDGYALSGSNLKDIEDGWVCSSSWRCTMDTQPEMTVLSVSVLLGEMQRQPFTNGWKTGAVGQNFEILWSAKFSWFCVETPQESKYTDTEWEQTVKRYRRGSTTWCLFCFLRAHRLVYSFKNICLVFLWFFSFFT